MGKFSKEKSMSQTLYPPGIEIPDSIFAKPTPQEYEQNQEYWDGYQEGKSMKSTINSPKGFKDYSAYKTEMENMYYKQATVKNFPINKDVGWNQACNDIINYLWTNCPESPHNKVVS